jgi:hypothetical protein
VKHQLNVFDIWKSIDCKIPFAARRDHWSNKNIYVIIDKIEPNGNYGKAYGYVTENGIINNYFNHNRKWCTTREIPNSGVGGWEYVEGVNLVAVEE